MIHRKGATLERWHLQKVYRNGPRYFVALLKTPWGEGIVLKTLLQTENIWAHNALTKEIAFYRWIQDYPDTKVSSVFTKLLAYEVSQKHLWRVQEKLVGEFQNMEPSQFLLRHNFDRSVNPVELARFLTCLHTATPEAPLSVKKWLKTSTLQEYEHFISWWRAPIQLVGPHLKSKVRGFLAAHRHLYDTQKKVLTHFEFYGAHLLITPQKKLKVIDWENVGLSDRTYDLVTLWLRAYRFPKWQEEFLSSFRKNCPEGFPFEKTLAVEAVLQSLGNIRFFARTTFPSEVKEKRAALDFYLATIKRCVG